MTPDPSSEPRDETAVAQFIERFASVLVEAGVPRMPSRVFSALLASDSGHMTAAELSERLLISPAAVSGAIRYLAQVNLVSRERERGARRDRYVVHGDVWYESTLQRERMLVRWADRLQEGIAALGPDSPAGRRMAETLAFVEFVQIEVPAVLDRWKEYRDRLRGEDAAVEDRGGGAAAGGAAAGGGALSRGAVD